MRASNYYRTAEYETSPTNPQFHIIWEKSVDSFRKGAVLFQRPIEYVNIQFEDKILPGYFWRPQENEQTRPTLDAAGGNDPSLEEVVWWIDMAAVRRGSNFFTLDHP